MTVKIMSGSKHIFDSKFEVIDNDETIERSDSFFKDSRRANSGKNIGNVNINKSSINFSY